MSIKKRLLATLGILFLIMIGISLFSVLMLNLVNQQSTVIAVELIPDLNNAQDLTLQKYRIQTHCFNNRQRYDRCRNTDGQISEVG